MTEQDNIVRKIFAYYGRIMYLAQTIEKGIMSLVVISQHQYGITKTRHDEILHEKSGLTFGQLRRDLKELDCFSDSELDLIEKFHEKRDFLAHSYWWERAVEFSEEQLQYRLSDELYKWTESFDDLHKIVQNKIKDFIEEHNLDLDKNKKEMIAQGRTIPLESFRKLNKNEKVISLFSYKNTEKSLIAIFELEDKTFWTVCEIGLTQYKSEIIPEKKIKLKGIDDILPLNQFNPRPKVQNPWNYELDLKKKGLKMIISKDSTEGVMRWDIKNTVDNKV